MWSEQVGRDVLRPMTVSLRRWVHASPQRTRVLQPLIRGYRALRPHQIGPEQQKIQAYDRMTVDVARRCLSGGGVAVDVGANNGGLLREFLRVSPTTRFVAVEPIPVLADRLREQWPEVTTLQVALSDVSGTATLRYLPDQAALSSLQVRSNVERGHRVEDVQVVVNRLDDVVREGPVEFVKVDVEGVELQV